MRGSDDGDQLSFATAQGRVLFSFNRAHFLRLHTEWCSAGRDHAGLILAGRRHSVGQQIHKLVNLVEALSAEEMRSCVEFLSAW